MANNEVSGKIEQIWYTWSTSGLGTMSAGYRVRAVSEGLKDIYGTRYRHLDSELRYTLPQGQGFNNNDFTRENAPICLAFLHDGFEKILVRKVFLGRDISGRNSVYFSHLLAGLPESFTPRDAILLWRCPALWKESDTEKNSKDTTLQPISYDDLRYYAKSATESYTVPFHFAAIQAQLLFIIQLFLTWAASPNEAPKLYLFGDSERIAALLWGLLHSLPLTLPQLGNLTFSTYDSDVSKSKVSITGTYMATDFPATYYTSQSPQIAINVNEARFPLHTFDTDVTNYAYYAYDYLLKGKIEELLDFVKGAEKRNISSKDAFIEYYKYKILKEPLTAKQLITILRNPLHETETLKDRYTQSECARILVENPTYWDKTVQQCFANLLQIAANQEPSMYSGELAGIVASFIEGTAKYVVNKLGEIIQQSPYDPTLVERCKGIIAFLAPPATNSGVWLYLLDYDKQNDILKRIKGEWSLLRWILENIVMLTPLPPLNVVTPWIEVTSWDALDRLLAINLPENWRKHAITPLLNRLGNELQKTAMSVIEKYEPLFLITLPELVQSPQTKGLALHCFGLLAANSYKACMPLLIQLLNAAKNDGQTVDTLFKAVAYTSPTQMTADEIDRVLEGCDIDVLEWGIRTSSTSYLVQYINVYLQNLNPVKLYKPQTQKVLQRFMMGMGYNASYNQDVVNYNFAVMHLLQEKSIDKDVLRGLGEALQVLSPKYSSTLPTPALGQVITDLLPSLIEFIVTETDVARVVDMLIGYRAVSDELILLSHIAELAGQFYEKTRQLSRLAPYISFIISEAGRLKSTPKIPAYLDALTIHLGNETLMQLNSSSEVLWPIAIQEEWRRWLKGRMRQASGPLPAEQKSKKGLLDFAPKRAISANAPYSAVKVNGKVWITFETYQVIHRMMREGLQYRLAMLKNSNASQVWIADEMQLSKKLLSIVQGSNASVDFANYLLDDRFLQDALGSLISNGGAFEQTFNTARVIQAHQEAFINRLEAAKRSSFTDEAFEDTQRMLLVFLRRETFHEYLAVKNKRISLKQWLDGQRKGKDIQYFK